MPLDPPEGGKSAVPVILVPEVRDFVRINAEVAGLLNQGHRRIRLDGADGQRLLLAGLAGDWEATIEVCGPTGPEFAANINAPGLVIVAHGSTQDGVGRGLRAGSILVLGDGGDAAGAAQAGGLIVVAGAVGHRAGLNQAGGVLAVFGSLGRLAGDRQSGGLLFLGAAEAGSFLGRGRAGGWLVGWHDRLDGAAVTAWGAVIALAGPRLVAGIPPRPSDDPAGGA